MPKIGGIVFPKVITSKTPGAARLEIYDSKTGQIITSEYGVLVWYCRTKLAICKKITRAEKGMFVGEEENIYFPNAKLRLKT